MVAALRMLISALSFISIHTISVAAQKKTFGSVNGVVAGKCAGQSCVAADIAGVTGNLPTQAVSGTAAGWVCVGKYNPNAKAAIDKLGSPTKSKSSPKRLTRSVDSIIDGITATYPVGTVTRSRSSSNNNDFIAAKLKPRQLGAAGKGSFKAKCTPNILIFAKGTSEFGDFGETVGPILRSSVKSDGGSGQWTSVGVDYSNTADGNYCIGLPGGMIAKKLLESAVSKCPSSKIFLSGYSQGAMVVRIAVAYANDQARGQVKGLVTYGDPFNGAQIKGYNGPIKVYCKPTDAVCTGQFKIGTSHFAYAAGADVRNGAKWMINIAKGAKGAASASEKFIL